jgi:hypothetical protein
MTQINTQFQEAINDLGKYMSTNDNHHDQENINTDKWNEEDRG